MNSAERTTVRDLTAEEIRVLGCLVEKQATTPDNYPLSSNALMAACNQSTSRDPIVDYSERTIDATMLSLRDRGLARTVRGDGQRVHKHRHVLDEAWSLHGASLAVLSVLMLRGAQTVAELRARTERYLAGANSDRSEDIEAALRGLAETEPPFVQLLPRRAGEREARWIHLLGEVPPPSEYEPSTGSPRRAVNDRVDALEAQLADVTARLDALTARFETLVSDLGDG
jgi:uncharacterized protein YceH (UPF0502 family)